MDLKSFEINDYYFKKVTVDLIPDLIGISQSAFGIKPAASYFIKKNETSAFGEPYLGFIAYSTDGKPAAFYGVYACEVELDGKIYRAVQSGDTMTHKDHGGKGLFTALAKATYAYCKEIGVEFVFGFPNYNSYPGFVKKLNWVCPGNMMEYRFRIFTLPVLKLVKKLPILNGLYKLYLNLIFSFYKPNIDFFKSSVIESGVGGIHRTTEFLRYKNYGGARLLKIAGTHVWLKPDGFLYIGDIERNEKSDIPKVVKAIKRFCSLIGADVLIFQTTPSTYLDKEFSKMLEPKEAFPYGFCNLNSTLNLEKFAFVFGDVDTF